MTPDLDGSGANRVTGRAAVGLGVAILLVSLSLRLPVTALGPVLEEIRADLGIGAGVAGVLTAVPVLVFALAGTLVPWLRRRLSLGSSIAVAMVAVVVGTLVRPFGTAALLLAGTVVIMMGIAVINVLLPVVVRSGFGGREGWITGGYVASLQVGAAAGASLTVPLATALGGWPRALASWAVVGLVGLVAWLPAARGVSASGRRDAALSHLRPSVLVRDRVTRNLTVFFGLQAMVTYIMMGWLPTVLRSQGMAASSAGAMVAVVTLVTIPVSLVLPGWLGSRPDQRLAPWFIVLPWWLAFAGLLVAPVRFAVVWAALLGIGVAGFPVTLALFGLRTASPSDTMQVSTFAQSMGYLIGLPGPLLAGVVADATGGWTVPLVLLCMVNVPILLTGLVSGTAVTIGHDLPDQGPVP